MENVIESRIEELNSKNLKQIKELYQNFMERAVEDYRFELMPLEFDDFCMAINENILNGFVLFEDSVAKGFLIYIYENHKAIELNIIHIIDNQNISARRKSLVQKLLKKYENNTEWTVVSYPMLGIQNSFVRDITEFNFDMVGQAVVRFNFADSVTARLFKNTQLPELPEGYEVTSWKEEYFEQASEVIYESFKTASDTLFDPRFLYLEGAKEIVHKIVYGIFGEFLTDETSVLLFEGKVVGVCFANLTNALIANVPLIGIVKPHKGKGLSKYLLRNTVNNIIQRIINGQRYCNEINATVETNNFPALNMYRKVGFREDYTYPHAYLRNRMNISL